MPFPIFLVASGDLRLSANRVCWPAQQAAEAAVTAAIRRLGHDVQRAHPFDSSKGHGFIDSQRHGMKVFRDIPSDSALIVVEAVWQYSHHVLSGLFTHKGPILTVANWSGQWPGLVGMLNLNGSLTKAGIHYSTLWSEDFTDEYGQTFSRYVIPRQNWVPLAPDERVQHPTPIRYALEKAVEETVAVTRFTLVSVVRLLQGRLSWDALSGPITIYEVAGEEGRKGTENFIWVMALLSINLGLLNLLPIPVLDGGHLMFFALEALLRRPLPLRLREMAHLVGMTIVIGLMAIAFKNDVEKRWDVIVGQVSELLG